MEIIGTASDYMFIVKIGKSDLARLFRVSQDRISVGATFDVRALAEKYSAALDLHDHAKLIRRELDRMSAVTDKVLEHSRLYLTLPKDGE